MKKKLFALLLILSMLLSLLAACGIPADNSSDTTVPSDTAAGGEPERPVLTLVADGTTDYVIVRGENAYISEITASTELQSYLKQITGVEIPIVTDATAPTEKEIVVGKTNREAEGEFDREELGDDGLVIKTREEKLFLVGGEICGTLYSVYEFLESYLGCRFYTEEVEKIPEQKVLTVDYIEEDKQIPVFDVRITNSEIYLLKVISAKRKLNSRHDFMKEYGGKNYWIRTAHSYAELVPPKTYYKEHPEYYSIGMSDAVIAAGANNDMGQLCLTNPEVLEIAIESTRYILQKYIAEYDYKNYYFSISQNDNSKYCTCDNCKALYTAEGSHAAATVQFANNIATALKDEFPQVMFETLAYRYTRNVPKTVKPVDNLAIRLCTIEECFSHPIDDSRHSDWINSSDAVVKNTFIEDLTAWAEVTDNLYVWDYTRDFGFIRTPYPNFNVLLRNVRLFADNNVKVVFEQNYESNRTMGDDFNSLRTYLISKVLWDPYMSEEEYQYHINDFLEGVYGKGWTFIREYLDLIEEASEPYCFGTFAYPPDIFGFGEPIQKNEIFTYPDSLTADVIRNYENVDWSEYWNYYSDITDTTPEVITKGYELFEKAYGAAETEQQKRDIERVAIQVDFLDSSYRYRKIECGEGAIKRMLNNFNAKNKDEFTMQERMEYANKITALAEEQTTEELIIFNTALLEKCIELGIKSSSEDIDLVAYPSYW